MPEPAPSPLGTALAMLGDRWSLQIVAELLAGPRRFNDLIDALPGLAPNVLTARMRSLEHEGLVVATPYSTRPLRAAYALTDRGRELAGVVALLDAWARREHPRVPTTEPGADTFDPTQLWETRDADSDELTTEDESDDVRFV